MSTRKNSLLTPLSATLALAALLSAPAIAQQPAQQSPAPGPQVGQQAPDFTLPGATRYGLLADPVSLSDFRGQTVVLAFFPKARSRG